MVGKPTERVIPSRWGVTLPLARVAVEILAILAALAALGYAAWQTELTRVSLDDQRRMSAYQLMGMEGVSPVTRWQGALVALRLDNEVSGFHDGCEKLSEAVTDLRAICVSHTDLTIDGSGSSTPWSLLRPTLTREVFHGGQIRHLSISEGSMTHTDLRPELMEDVAFYLMDLQSLTLAPNRLGSSKFSTAIRIFRSSLKDSVLDVRQTKGLNIGSSDISGMRLFGVDVVLQGNWYLKGHPPLLEGVPTPNLASFVCRTALSIGDLPVEGDNCRLIGGGA